MADPVQERITALEQRLSKEPQSPLFARLAALYLQSGRAQDALKLCDDGLANFPFYATAHLVKGKALASLNMLAEAKHEYEVVREFLPTNATVAKLHSSIELPPPEVHVEPPAEEKAVTPPVVVAAPPPPAPVEEPVLEESAAAVVEEAPPASVVEEVAPAQVEEAQPQQPPVEEAQVVVEPEPAPSVDEGFGFGETPPAPPEPESPSAGDKLGLEYQSDRQVIAPQDDFGAPVETPSPSSVEENPFGEQPPAAQELVQEEVTPEPIQEEAAPEPVVETAPEPSASGTAENPEWLEAFSQLQQAGGEVPVAEQPAAATPAEEENPFAMFETEQAQPQAAPTEGEPYEDFSARMRMELFGTEETMSLEEYLGQTAATEPSPAPADEIGDLAEKLKSSPKITPPVINFSEKTPRSAGDGTAPDGSGIITPTLAEIYVKQGWYDDAIKAYKVLGTNKPAEKSKYDQRIAEIEEMKKMQ